MVMVMVGTHACKVEIARERKRWRERERSYMQSGEKRERAYPENGPWVACMVPNASTDYGGDSRLSQAGGGSLCATVGKFHNNSSIFLVQLFSRGFTVQIYYY